MKFNISEFFENLSTEYAFHWTLTTTTGTLLEYLRTFMIVCRWILFEWCFRKKVVKEIKKIMVNNIFKKIVPFWGNVKQESKCTYSSLFRCIRETTVAVEKPYVLNIVRVCSLSYLTCKAYAPCIIVISDLSLCSMFFHCLINGTIFGKKLSNLKCLFRFSPLICLKIFSF